MIIANVFCTTLVSTLGTTSKIYPLVIGQTTWNLRARITTRFLFNEGKLMSDYRLNYRSGFMLSRTIPWRTNIRVDEFVVTLKQTKIATKWITGF